MTREELLNQASKVLADVKLDHKRLGILTIVEAIDVNDAFDGLHDLIINAKIDSTNEIKRLSLKNLYEGGFATLMTKPADAYYTKTFQNEFNDILTAEDEAFKVQYKATKEAEKLAAAEAKYTAKVTAALKKLNSVEKANIKLDYANIDDFYMALGWMTKHVGTVSAAMPDYAEKWFISKFGDVTRRVVSSKKKTVNGNPIQWALSMKVTFKKVNEIPPYLVGKINDKHEINSVEFVWDLVDTYGFKFGQEQDVEAIRSIVPADKINSFELGYNC